MQLWMVGGIPDQIIPVASLDPVLPFAEENCVHLAGKKVGKRVATHGKRDRLEQIARLGRKVRRRISVHLNLYLQHLPGWNPSGNFIAGLDYQQLVAGISL